MCNGGRVMNYLKAMLGGARHDVLFVGFQASGTMGRLIQKYGQVVDMRPLMAKK
jgi:metallo-beta-lactamase family protein